MSRGPRWTLIVGCVLAACGGDDDGGTPVDAPDIDAAIDAPAAVDAATGQIWIRANDISGATNKIVLTNITAVGGGPSMGGICVQLMSSPASFVAAVRMFNGSGPCQLGAEVNFPDGTYAVVAGLYTPGMQQPELCASTTVTVAGSGDVTLPPLGACP